MTTTPNFVKRDIVTGGYDVMLNGREIGYVTKGLAITLSGSALVTRWTARATDAHGQYQEIGTWPTRQAAAAALVEAAAVPPPHVQANPTPADVKAFPAFFIHGAGRHIASVTDCGHGYNLTDSCPNCD